MTDIELKVDKFVTNYQSKNYKDYIDIFQDFYSEKKKCLKGKKCTKNFINNNDKLIMKKGKKNIDIVKPKYLIIDKRLEEIDDKINNIDYEIRFLQYSLNSKSKKEEIQQYEEFKTEFNKLNNEREIYKLYENKIDNIEDKKKQLNEFREDITNGSKVNKELYNKIIKYYKTKKIEDYKSIDKLIEEYINSKKYQENYKKIKDLKNKSRTNFIVTELPKLSETKKKIIKKKSNTKKTNPKKN
jgi:vacuolar-type H+-ATPase subunit I/STV1